MKKVIAVGGACAASVLVGPAIAGGAGLQATDGFDGADVVCILTGLASFFLLMWVLGFVGI
jgi:hypothetical protein